MSTKMHNKSLALIGAFSILCVVIALISQYHFDMQPCPWCILQRVIFIMIALSCLGLYFIQKKPVSISWITLLCTAGQVTAAYQFAVASHSTSCKLSMAEKIISSSYLDQWFPFLFEIKASCADAVVKIMGINYEIFSLAAFTLISTVFLLMNILPSKKMTTST